MVNKAETNSNDMDSNLQKRKGRQLLLNFSALCTVWLFNFTAFSGLQNLQASMNADTGIFSLVAVTSGGLISCIIAPVVIGFVGSKGVLVIACLCQAIFISANYYPKSYILIPAGAINGLSTGLMWTVQGCYLTSFCVEYQKISNKTLNALLSIFSGIFFMAFQSSQIIGNLISSVVFQSKSNSMTFTNNSFCGANFCPTYMFGEVPHNGSSTSDNTDVQNHYLIYVLISVYLCCTIVALLVVIFGLKPIKTSVLENYPSFQEQLSSSFRALTDKNVLMVVPFYFFIGVELVVMYVQFTMSFVACRLGMEWIGYCMLCFGAVDTIASPVFGYIGKYTGRLPQFIFATFLNIGLLVVMRFWDITNDESAALLFIIPAFWGVCDGIWMTQSQALVGSVFHQNPEPTFAACVMFQAAGSAVAYLYNVYLCEHVKIYVVAVSLLVAVTLIIILEIKIKRQNNRNVVVEEKLRNPDPVSESLLKSEIQKNSEDLKPIC